MVEINKTDVFWWVLVLIITALSIFDIYKHKWKSNENSSNIYDNSRVIGSIILVSGIIISVIIYLFFK
jgi:hypothetical protein